MILIFLCVVETAFAGKWRLRAREHFDTVTLKYGNQIENETTSGIGPTINFWWEEAYENSFGLALGLMYIDFARESESMAEDNVWNSGSLDLRANMIHSREMGVFFCAGVFQKTN